MRAGMVGLGRTGATMAERLRRHGHTVVGYDRDPQISDVASLEALVAALDGADRRVVWGMVSGRPHVRDGRALADILDDRDLVVDGGNTNWGDRLAHGELLSARGVGFVEVGVSGGAGRFAEMVHNGIEHGVMQAYATGYEIPRAAHVDVDLAATFEVWRHGNGIRWWLLDLLADALADDPHLDSVAGYVEDSGEGRWTVQNAIDAAVPVPAIASALFARFASRQDPSPAMRVIAILRAQFGGHEIPS